MKKTMLLICSRNSPGPLKVISNLQPVVSKHIQADCIYIEDILIPRLHLRRRSLNYKYLRIQEHLRFLNLGRITNYGSNVFIVGWGALCDILLKRLNKQGIRPYLIMCSTIGQSDFNEIDRRYLLQVIDSVKKGRFKDFLLNKRLYMLWRRVLPQATYFPHPIDLSQFKNVIPQNLPGVNIDILVSLRPGKNVMNQIFAVKLSQVNGTLHINFRNSEVKNFIKVLNLKTIIHPWIPDSEYYSLVAGMTLSLQVTFTESFSYAVCERMCLDVPVITSYDIDLISEDKSLSKYLCVNALDTPAVIAEKIKRIVFDSKLRADLAARCRHRIERIAKIDNKYITDFVVACVK